MKKEFWRISLLFSLCIIIFSSCYRDISLRLEDRMISGNWSFEKVRHFEAIDLVGKLVTAEYNDIKVNFGKDKTMEYNENGQLFSGKWDLKIDRSGEQMDLELIASLVNDEGEIKTIVWENIMFINGRIRAIEYFDDGRRIRYFLKNES